MNNQKNHHARHHVGLILALAGLMSAAMLVLATARIASAQAVYPRWNYTGNLSKGRFGHTATLLPNGKVLVVGNWYNTAELYDPTAGAWSYTGNLNTGRTHGHTATLLPNGKVLVAGGYEVCDPGGGVCHSLNRAELYDPATGTWSVTGDLNTARQFHTATLLPNGKVLLVGGSGDTTAELYNPATGTWSYTGSLNTPRSRHTAILLPNGKVLVACGQVGPSSAELYDPASGTWGSTSSPNGDFSRATLLPNGKVLALGGYKSAELYDPATGIWSSTGNTNYFDSQTATLLPNGKVLVTGGDNGLSGALNGSEQYDPATGTWKVTAYLNTGRLQYTTTLLLNGKVLAAGGSFDTTATELYDPSSSPNSNIVDDAKFFVQQHYADFLNREPDAGGLAYWTARITECGSDARCIHERRIGVSAAFFVEMEFQDTGYYVYRFYKASFGRQPNYAEFTSDRRSLGCDEEGKCFADYWVESGAFLQAYPNTMSNTEFVDKLFDTAGLSSSRFDAQRQQEIAAMNAGRSRALVLRDVIEIPDFKNIPDPNSPRYEEIKQTSQYNPAFVLMQYFGYLRRNVDQDGYDFWLDVVNNREPNNYRAMVCAFITSTEYQLRFGSVVTRSNTDCAQ